MTDIHKFVLVAEDDKFYANVYKRKLEIEGYEVVIAKNGQEALDIIKTRTPDLILLDLIMPIVDGFGVLAEIKNKDQTKNIKVIVLSNLGQMEDMEKAKKLGADEYIVKSNLTIDELMDRIKAAI